MKHTYSITLVMLALFLGSQLVGLALLDSYLDKDTSEFKKVYLGGLEIERPETTGPQTLALIAFAILIGTALIFLLMKFAWNLIWRAWFFLALVACLGVAFTAFIPEPYPLLLAFILAGWRILRPNPILHNLTELFIYGGLAIIFVPLLNLKTAIILLILISVYDAYAVWKSKHMIKLAKFQAKSKLFAGMVVPYSWKKMPKLKKPRKTKGKVIKTRTAILGGGDMGFPLFFAGTALIEYGILKTLLIPACATIALAYLLYQGDKNKFYPAMPYLTVGCFIGLALIQLL
ncbi:MAG: presenilin family intramembrane aspartyl protease [Candidatus Nanoarchaeia archaeon]